MAGVVKYVRMSKADAAAIEAFCKANEVSHSLAIRLVILTSPILAPYRPAEENKGNNTTEV